MPAVTRTKLDQRILDWMREDHSPRDQGQDDTRFEALALEAFRYQLEHCEPYAKYCANLGAHPDQIHSWKEIPPVPTEAFKELSLVSFPFENRAHTFRTSGTSNTKRGEFHLDTLKLYEASLLPTFRTHLFHDVTPTECEVFILAPSKVQAPDSSLSHMFSIAARELDFASVHFFVENGKLEVELLLRKLEGAIGTGKPIALLGTAFSFVHLIDAMSERNLQLTLPPRSFIMETGGFKGRSRECSQEELYGLLEERLGIPPLRIVNQYGMTELGSQFYDSNLLYPLEPRRKLGPPWARVSFVDPESGQEVPDGTVGVVRIVDLANTPTIVALQTADLGRKIGDGFTVLGRQSGAEARGCSIAADSLFSGLLSEDGR